MYPSIHQATAAHTLSWLFIAHVFPAVKKHVVTQRMHAQLNKVAPQLKGVTLTNPQLSMLGITSSLVEWWLFKVALYAQAASVKGT